MKDLRERIPLGLVFGLAAMPFYVSAALYMVFLPLFFLYQALICALGWCILPKQGKTVLIVHTQDDHSTVWLSKFRSTLRQPTLLNYDERKSWKYWSFPTHAFEAFGPKTMPSHLTPSVLPGVIVMERFRWPQRFAFGPHSRNLGGEMGNAAEETRILKIRS